MAALIMSTTMQGQGHTTMGKISVGVTIFGILPGIFGYSYAYASDHCFYVNMSCQAALIQNIPRISPWFYPEGLATDEGMKIIQSHQSTCEQVTNQCNWENWSEDKICNWYIDMTSRYRIIELDPFTEHMNLECR